VLTIEARQIRARRRAGGVVWFDFAVLCGGPRSQNDYLEIAARFHTVLLSNVPRMSAGQASEARRFTWLVDVLYDHRVKLLMSAEVPAASCTGPAHCPTSLPARCRGWRKCSRESISSRRAGTSSACRRNRRIGR
jgi:hypothetical protein